MEKVKISHYYLTNSKHRKSNENSPKKRLNYSFSKEFINTFSVKEEENEDNPLLAKSHLDLGDIIKMQEEILGESKEASSTILDEKIKKNLFSKNINIPKLKVFANHNDIDANEIEKNNIIINNNFLKIRNIPEISKDKFEKMKMDLLDDNYLEELKNFILDFKYKLNSSNPSVAIGSLFPLERLIESNFNNDSDFSNEMIAKYNLYRKYIYNYRTIKGDGNCYYRAVMFRYFEIIILNKEIFLLQNIIFDMKKSFYSNEIISRKEIKMNTIFKPELPLKIMFIILDLIKKNNEELAHLIFLKSLLICPIFDFGLIFYFRYIIYSYIKENEDKLYLKNFPIKIGNLLPSKYETEDGQFLFNSFYQNYLLKMFMDAEKIIIYLTPFILGINLDIIIFDDESEIIKKINYDGKPDFEFDDKIFLMNKKNHYEIIYSKNYNEKYKALFNKYINNNFIKESIILHKINKKNIFDNNQGNNFIVNSHKDSYTIFSENINGNNNMNFQENTLKQSKIKKKFKIKKPKMKTANKRNIYLDNDLNNNYSLNEIKAMKENYIHYNTIENDSKIKFSNLNKNNIESKENERNNYTINNDEENDNIIKMNLENKILNEQMKKTNEENVIKNHRIKKINKKMVNSIINTNKYTEKNNELNEKPIIRELKEKELNQLYTERIKMNIPNTLENSNPLSIKRKLIKKKKKLKEPEKYNSISKNNHKKLISLSKEKNMNTNFNTMISERNNIEIINTDINISNNLKSKMKSLTTEKRVLKTKITLKRCQCINCNEKYSMKPNVKSLFNLCFKCLKGEIIKNFYEIYLNYIKNLLESEYEDEEIKLKFNDLIQSSVTINNKNISLKESINQLYNYYPTIKDSFELIYQEIFKEIQKNVCLTCCHKMDNNQEKKIIIPCGCNFCSNSHFEFFFREKKFINIEKEFICYCSYKYNPQDIYNLGLQFSKLYYKLLRKSVIDYLNNKLKEQCCVCKSKELFCERIRYKDNSPDNKDILANYKELKHFFCKNCNENIKDKDSFICNICYKEHIFRPRK